MEIEMVNAVSQNVTRGIMMVPLILCPAFVWAQAPAVTVRSVSLASRPPFRFSYDSQLIIPTTGAAPLPGALQARIIRGTKADVAKEPADADGCVTFVASRVHPVRRATGGGLFVAQLTSEWLEPENLNDGRYVVVVEQDTTNSPVLRVRKADVPNYLAGAVEIIVERGELRVRRITRLVFVRTQRGGQDVGHGGDLGTCVTVQARPDVVALLLPTSCSPDRRTPDVVTPTAEMTPALQKPGESPSSSGDLNSVAADGVL